MSAQAYDRMEQQADEAGEALAQRDSFRRALEQIATGRGAGLTDAQNWEVCKQIAADALESELGPRGLRLVRADEVMLGMWVLHGPYDGEVVEVFVHPRTVGDGSACWFTFRVRPTGWNGGRASFTDTMGPHREDDQISVR